MEVKFIDKICSEKLWGTTKKAAKSFEYLIFDPIYTKELEKGLKAEGTSVGASFKNAYHETKKATGGRNLFRRIWDELKGIGPEYKAMNAKTFVGEGGKKLNFFGRVGKALGPLGKRMPLIGNLVFLGLEIPNVINAFKNGGIGTGLIETAKAAVKFGAFALGAAVGTALGGPLGGIAGGMALGWVADKICGKTFTDKQQEFASVDTTSGADAKPQTDATSGADTTAQDASAPDANITKQEILTQQLLGNKPSFTGANDYQSIFMNSNNFGGGDMGDQDFMGANVQYDPNNKFRAAA